MIGKETAFLVSYESYKLDVLEGVIILQIHDSVQNSTLEPQFHLFQG